jgi:hypothetical protein
VSNQEPVKRTPEELKEALLTQLRRLHRLALQYDKGDVEVAVDLSATLHTLLNPNRPDATLKRFVGIDVKTLKFASTPEHGLPFRLVHSLGQGHSPVGEESELQASYEPRYDRDVFHFPTVAFDDWYSKEAVFQLAAGPITREDLIDAVRNREGGAHLDDKIPPKYATVSRQEEFKHSISDGKKSAESDVGAQYASIRQIAFEVQLSFSRELSSILDFDLNFPAPPERQIGSTLRAKPDKAYLESILADMRRSGEWDEVEARHIQRALFWDDLTIGPLEMERERRARAQKPSGPDGSDPKSVEPESEPVPAETRIGLEPASSSPISAEFHVGVDTLSAEANSKANLLRKIDELRALIEQVGPVAEAFDEKRASIGHNKPPNEYEPDNSGLPPLGRSDLDAAVLALNIIRDQVAADRVPDTDADTLARRTLERVFKLIAGALRWLGKLANRTIIETLAKKIADVDAQTWTEMADRGWEFFSGFFDQL